MRNSVSRRRLALVLVGALLTCLLFLNGADGQVPRGGTIPRPPVVGGGGFGGGGAAGGVPGMPNVPKIPQPPNALNGGNGVAGGGIPNMPQPPGFGGQQFLQFTCTKCGKIVGQGRTMQDAPASCPFCGVHFTNGGLGSGKLPVGGNVPNQIANPQVPAPDQPFTPAPSSSTPSSTNGNGGTSSDDKDSSSHLPLVIGLSVGGGVVGLGVLAAGAFGLIYLLRSGAPTKRLPPRRELDLGRWSDRSISK
jgi:hypothetical protein